MKPFDLEKAKAGEKVCTRDGRKARIVCFDALGAYPLVVLYMDECGYETSYTLNVTGEYWIGGVHIHNNDLFMAEPEIPEGWTAYDPNVPPPDTALTIDILYEDGLAGVGSASSAALGWETFNSRTDITSKRIAWKIVEFVREEKPSLEDARNNVSREVYECMLHGMGANMAHLDNALQQFAEAIIKRAVEEARK